MLEVRSNEVFPKRFAVAYRDEESLREVSAAPCIRGIGFTSRKAAVAVTPNSSSRKPIQRTFKKSLPSRLKTTCANLNRRSSSCDTESGLVETRRIACAALQYAIAVGFLMFDSKSALGAAVRAFVGA